MKKSTRERVGMAGRKSEKEAISREEEEQFWAAGQLGGRTSKSLLNTAYYYNGKLFGLRHGEHRNITVNNFKVGSNYIEFECQQNLSWCDMKYAPRKVRHVCHKDGEKHEVHRFDQDRL